MKKFFKDNLSKKIDIFWTSKYLNQIYQIQDLIIIYMSFFTKKN